MFSTKGLQFEVVYNHPQSLLMKVELNASNGSAVLRLALKTTNQQSAGGSMKVLQLHISITEIKILLQFAAPLNNYYSAFVNCFCRHLCSTRS